MTQTSFLSSLLFLFLLVSGFLFAQPTMDNYGSYLTIGLNVNLNTPDPEGDAFATVRYKDLITPYTYDGHPLSRVDNGLNQLSGSLFWLIADEAYEVEITLSDSTTPALDGVVQRDTVRTQREIGGNTPAMIYHVAPNGNGNFTLNNPGSLDSAFKLVGPGEQILLASGEYFTGDLELANDGLPGAPILISAEFGDTAIINGADTLPLNWLPNGSSWKTDVSATDVNLVVANGKRLYPYNTLTEMSQQKIVWESQCRPSGLDGFWRNTTVPRIYLKFANGAQPDTLDIEVSAHSKGIILRNKQYVQFYNVHFRNFGVNPEGAAVLLDSSHHIRISDCHFKHNDIGLAFAGNSSDLLIEQCDFGDSYGDWNFWRMKATYDVDMGQYLAANLAGCGIDLNYFHDDANHNRSLERGGVYYLKGFSGRGINIRENHFHDMVQGGMLTPYRFDTSNTRSFEIDFYENEVYNCSEDGFEIDYGARNVRVWNNVFHDVNAPLSLAPASEGPTYILRNLFHSFTVDTNWIASFGNFQYGHPLKFSTGDNTGCGDVFFYHNTVVAKDSNWAMDLKPNASNWQKLSLLNNIFMADQRPALYHLTSLPFPLELDYNDYLSNATHLIYFDNSTIGPVNFTNLNDFTTQRGYEANGLSTHPFNGAPPDQVGYLIDGASTVLEKGVFIEGINDVPGQFVGLQPDMGHYEFTLNVSRQEVDLASIAVYPNPNEGSFVVDGQNLSQSAVMQVCDLSGKEIFRHSLVPQSKNRIELPPSAKGLYVYRILQGPLILANGKLVVQ